MDKALQERLDRLDALRRQRVARAPSEAPRSPSAGRPAPPGVDGQTGEILEEIPLALEPLLDRNVAPVGAGHPGTSHRAADQAKPKSGSWRRKFYEYIATQPEGVTDDEMEVWSGRPHQSSSAIMSTLRHDGLLVPLLTVTGYKQYRKTRLKNDAVVWTIAPEGEA